MQLRRLAVGLLAALTLTAGVLPNQSLAQEAPTSPQIDLQDPLAPFLESRAVAKALGATAEFNKMEGVALDPVNRKLYIAMTAVVGGMSDAKGDIQLPANECGAVYAADLDADWNIGELKPVVVGGPYNADDKANRCSTDSIANPDNLFVDAKGNLWIGEDTDLHENNYLWMWNGKELKRFAAVPNDAEVTGLYITPAGDMFMNIQHPSAMNAYPFNRGVIGAVTGFQAGREFKSLAVPQGEVKNQVSLAAGSYQVLGRSGESIPGDFKGERFGQSTSASGKVSICNNPDGNMFLPTNGAGTEGYLYTNFECRPGGVSKLYVKQVKGQWQAIEGENVDFMPVGGTWNNCFAAVTPWNTALTSEEYEPAVNADWAKSVSALTSYLGKPANPYDYGYNVELVPSGVGTKVTKRFAMGRFSHENAVGMPDQKTFYQTDDGSNVVLFKFVADKAGDLSAGTLYAAKIKQTGTEKDYRFGIEWVKLGSGNDKEIQAGVRALDARFGR